MSNTGVRQSPEHVIACSWCSKAFVCLRIQQRPQPETDRNTATCLIVSWVQVWQRISLLSDGQNRSECCSAVTGWSKCFTTATRYSSTEPEETFRHFKTTKQHLLECDTSVWEYICVCLYDEVIKIMSWVKPCNIILYITRPVGVNN